MKLFLTLSLLLVAAFAKPLVSVSIPPTKYLVQKIAGDTVEINVIIPSGTDEHSIDFKPATMKQLEKSDLYFTVGLEIEKVFEDKFKKIFKKVTVVDTGKGLRTLEDTHSHDDHGHGHGHHGHDDHDDEEESKDPHIWFDPILAKAQAEIIAKALIAKYSKNKDLYEANLATLQTELDALHKELTNTLKKAKNKKFIIYHPSLAYFAARYKLTQLTVEIEGKEPKAKDLEKLISTAKKEKIKIVLVQKGFSQGAAKTLADELKAKVLEIDNLNENFGEELLRIAKILS